MLKARDFRRVVLGLRDASEGAHMGHPDFRVNGRIFASLNGDQTRGMVVLTPEQQDRFVREHPAMFAPENGAWGLSGCTRVLLQAADEETLGEAATLAWQNSIAKGPARTRAKTASTRAATTSAPATRRPRKPSRRGSSG